MAINMELILIFVLANFVLFTAEAENSTSCLRSCGNSHLNFPFGFSDGCEIRLTCRDSGEIQISGFRVLKVTSDTITLHMPPKCDRKVEQVEKLFSPNYAVSVHNALLFENCSSLENNCTIPTVLLESRFDLRGCHPATRYGNVSCYPAAAKGNGRLTYEDIARVDCRFLYTSIVDSSGDKDMDMDISLQFHTVQLDWWLLGGCNCASHADCRGLIVRNGSSGYRCSCRDGLIGDGFALGSGCRRENSSKKTFINVLIGGIIAGACAVGFLVLICYGICRHSATLRSRRSAQRFMCEAGGNASVLVYPYKEIDRATCGFSEQKKLGTGAYGTVYQGRLSNDECVAIKKIKNNGTGSTKQVMNEIKLISSVSHPNLVRLLGCCIENGEQILVYEFMGNGTLSQHLQREKGKVLPWTIRLTIATETAQAIAYLHTAMNPPIYHRDIKSSNILLDLNYKSKVADFGLSRVGMTAESSHISTAPQGTPGYVDPQYHQNYHLSDKSDVYSFGVVLLEMITAMKVVDFSRPQTEINLAALAVERIGKGRLEDIIDPFIDPRSHRDAWTLTSIRRAAELAFRCLAYHRDMRPSMTEVAEELDQIRRSGWATPDETGSAASSCCSSPFNSPRAIAATKEVVSLEEGKEGSPVTVQDPWSSVNSSPSAHSLL